MEALIAGNEELSGIVHAIQKQHGEQITFKQINPSSVEGYLDIVFSDGQQDIHRCIRADTLLLAIDLYVDTCTWDPIKGSSSVLNRKNPLLSQ